MSHSIAEIVIPPTDNIELAVKQMMKDTDAEDESHPDWWDFYVIGGRFSGHKLECKIGTDRLKQFHELLIQKKVTVSGLRCGKPDLAPSSQIESVDALWREHFPGFGEKCVLFAHSRDQYGKQGIYADDICAVSALPDKLTCDRLLIAHKRDDGELYPIDMWANRLWNGVSWQDTDFDGNVKTGIEKWKKQATERYRSGITVGDDWLVVTVDYHN